MSRYKPKPKHNASWIEEHKPDKYEKQLLAGEAALQKFLKKTNNKYFIIFVKGGFYNPRSQKVYDAYLKFHNDNGEISIYCTDWSKKSCMINKKFPPYHMDIEIDGNEIDLEKLFSKSNNDWKIYYFDDEDGMKLFLEVTEGG